MFSGADYLVCTRHIMWPTLQKEWSADYATNCRKRKYGYRMCGQSMSLSEFALSPAQWVWPWPYDLTALSQFPHL